MNKILLTFSITFVVIIFTFVETFVSYSLIKSLSQMEFFFLISIKIGLFLFLFHKTRKILSTRYLLILCSFFISSVLWSVLGPGVYSGDINDYYNYVVHPHDIDEEYSPLLTLIYQSIFRVLGVHYVYLGLIQFFFFSFCLQYLVTAIFERLQMRKFGLQFFVFLLVFLNPIVLGQSLYYVDLFFTCLLLILIASIVMNHSLKTISILAVLTASLRLNSPVLLFVLPFILVFATTHTKRSIIKYFLIILISFTTITLTLKSILVKQEGSYGPSIAIFELAHIESTHPKFHNDLSWLHEYVNIEEVSKNFNQNSARSFPDAFYSLSSDADDDYYDKYKVMREAKEVIRRYLSFFKDHPWTILRTKAFLYANQLLLYPATIPEPYFLMDQKFSPFTWGPDNPIPVVSPTNELTGLRQFLRNTCVWILTSWGRFHFISPVFYFFLSLSLGWYARKRIPLSDLKSLIGASLLLPLLYHFSFFLVPYGYGIKYLLPLFVPLKVLTVALVIKVLQKEP